MKKSKDQVSHTDDSIIGYLKDGFAFSVATDLINVGTAETPFVRITNPIGSGKNILFDSITFGSDTTSQRILTRFYVNPTITGAGTPLIPGNNFVGSANASIATAASGITTSSNGTFISMFIAQAAGGSNVLKRGFIISPGITVMITFAASQNNTPCHAAAFWSEIPI